MLPIPFPWPFLVFGAFGALFKSGISLVQFCFVMKMRIFSFFSSGSRQKQASADFLYPRFLAPTLQLILWPRELSLCVCAVFHAAAVCQLSSPFFPVLKHVRVHVSLSSHLTLALLLLVTPETLAALLWTSCTVQSVVMNESCWLSVEPSLRRRACCFFLGCNTGCPSSLPGWSLLPSPGWYTHPWFQNHSLRIQDSSEMVVFSAFPRLSHSLPRVPVWPVLLQYPHMKMSWYARVLALVGVTFCRIGTFLAKLSLAVFHKTRGLCGVFP